MMPLGRKVKRVEKGDLIGIKLKFNEEKDKIGNSDHLLPLIESQNMKDENGDAEG